LGEVEVVVQDLASVVENRRRFLYFARNDNDFFQSLSFQTATGKQFVKVVYVGLEMFAVVELESLFADNGL
jgi:hypothetical protein